MTDLKTLIPEIGVNQYALLEEWINENVIGANEKPNTIHDTEYKRINNRLVIQRTHLKQLLRKDNK